MRKLGLLIAFCTVATLFAVLPVQARLPDLFVAGEADVWVSKTAGTEETEPGRKIRYFVIIGNQGPDDATVRVTDILPHSDDNYWLTWEWDNGPLLGFTKEHTTGENERLSWEGTLAAGQSVRLEIVLAVDPNTPGCQPLINHAEIEAVDSSDPNPANNAFDFYGPRVAIPNLGVVKSVSGLAIPGEVITYTIEYSSACQSAHDVVITDVLPAMVSFVSANPLPSSMPYNALVWRDADLAAHSTETLIVNCRINDDAQIGQVLTNTVEASCAPPENTPNNNTFVLTHTIGRADLEIVKTGPVFAAPGQTIDYLLTYTNTGSSPASAVEIVDILPQGVTYITSAVNGVGIDPVLPSWGNEYHWRLGELASDGTSVLSVTVQIDEALVGGSTITNTADIMTETPERNYDNNASSWRMGIQWSDLRMWAIECPLTTTPSGTITYRYAFENMGMIAATNVVISNCLADELDANSLVATIDPEPTAPPEQTGNCFQWTLPNLEIGQVGTIEITVDVLASAGAGMTETIISNVTRISSDIPEGISVNNEARCETTVTRSDLTLIKTVDLDEDEILVPGNMVAFTLSYRNNGATDALNVEIRDVLPNALLLDPVDTTPAPEPNPDTGPESTTYAWPLGDLAPGDGGEITLMAMVDRNVTWHAIIRELENTASITTTSATSSVPEGEARATVRVSPGCPFTLLITPTLIALPADGTSTTDLAVGLYDIDGNQVLDGTRIDARTDHGRFSNGTKNAFATTTSGEALFTLTASSKAATATVLFVVTDVGEGGCAIGDLGDISDTQEIIFQEAPLSITKTVEPAYDTEPGEPVTYSIVYSNAGPGVAKNTQIVDDLPEGFVLNSVQSNPPVPYAANDNQLVFDVGDLDESEGGTITVLGTFDATPSLPWEETQVLQNEVAIESDTHDPDTTDNEDQADSLLLTVDIGVEQNALQSTVYPGNRINYEVVIRNDGPGTARRVSLTDTLPKGCIFVAATLSPTTIEPPDGDTPGYVIFDVGNLAANKSYTMTIVAEASCSVSSQTTMTNYVEVSTSTYEHDPNGTRNNEATNSGVTVVGPNLQVELLKTEAPFCCGTPFVYRIRYKNSGDITVDNVVLRAEFSDLLTLPDPNKYPGVTGGPQEPGWRRVYPDDMVYELELGSVGPKSSGVYRFVWAAPADATEAVSDVNISGATQLPCPVQDWDPDILVANACKYLSLILGQHIFEN